MSDALGELRGPVRALFTDLDGTLTSDGRLDDNTLRALGDLFGAGLPVVLVTGRPAGWGHSLASLFPFAAVVTENGGLSFVPESGAFRKLYGVAEDELPEWRSRMQASARAIMSAVPGARLSADSAYREVDLAIDWNEEVSLSTAEADRIVGLLRADGFAASRSSVHVNYGPPTFDKFTASQRILEDVFGEVFDDKGTRLDDYVFVGDSLNDAPMFAGFPKSVGVANIQERWDELPHKPKYKTDASEGAGFCELVSHILAL
jgi:HAD superfamily hydrolase (TIGR01484 family)